MSKMNAVEKEFRKIAREVFNEDVDSLHKRIAYNLSEWARDLVNEELNKRKPTLGEYGTASRANVAWNDHEDETLKDEFYLAISQIAIAHRRSRRSIKYRLEKLGIEKLFLRE